MNALMAVNAYRQVGQQGVQEERLLVLGLDGILEYLRRARGAIQDQALDDCAAVVTALRDSWIEGLRRE